MNIVVPQLGESVIEARIARWVKHEGDSVATGDVLVELETDKIDLEVSAESAGVLSKIARQDGEDVKVGEVLGVIETGAQSAGVEGAAAQGAGAKASGARDQGPEASEQQPVAAASSVAQAVRPASASAATADKPAANAPAPRSTPTARKMAEEHGVDLSTISGTGDGGRVTRDDVEKHVGTRNQGPGASAPASAPAPV